MFFRSSITILLILLLLTGIPSFGWAQLAIPDESQTGDKPVSGGFEKPYEYERQAYGYDPEGVDYKENQPEDFQVIFISSLPFTALASFGLTGLVSLAARGNFGVGGDYFLPFLVLTGTGSTTIACVSVLTNKYPPPSSGSFVENTPYFKSLAFKFPLVTMRF